MDGLGPCARFQCKKHAQQGLDYAPTSMLKYTRGFSTIAETGL